MGTTNAMEPSSSESVRVTHLTALGFSRVQAVRALQQCHGSVERAANVLFNAPLEQDPTTAQLTSASASSPGPVASVSESASSEMPEPSVEDEEEQFRLALAMSLQSSEGQQDDISTSVSAVAAAEGGVGTDMVLQTLQ